MRRNKLFAVINILGFALGIACCITIMLWVRYQWSFNQFHSNIDRIHRVLRIQKVSNAVHVYRQMPGPFGAAVKAETPQAEDVVHLLYDSNVLASGNQSFREEGMHTHSSIFSVFSFPILAGSPSTALDNPNSIAVSEKLAKKIFGTTDVIGKSLRLDGNADYTVSLVFRDIPKNSSIQFDYALSLNEYIKKNEWARGWGNNSFSTFILLKKGSDLQSVNAQLYGFLQRKSNVANETLFTQPFSESYLYNKFENGVQQGGRIETVRLFIIIALMVLALACINFTNLTTAQGIRRSKEIGIRKTIGATRSGLILQLLGESIITTIIALPLALLFVEISLPMLEHLTDATVKIPVTEPWFWIALPIFGIIIGSLAGMYPAFVLSSLATASVLKGTLYSGPRGLLLRRGLVILEFTVAVAFIASTYIVYQQIEFIKNKDIGLNRENVISFPVDIAAERFTAWEQELLSQPSIVSVSGAGFQSPIQVGSNTGGMRWKGQMPDERIMISFIWCGYSFLKTMGIQLKEGRMYSPAFPADTANYIINETCARQMRLSSPIGETLRWGSGDNARTGKVVGVVKDFHHNSMKEAIDPIMLLLVPKPTTMLVRFRDGHTEAGLQLVRESFIKYQPGLPLSYAFLDDEFNELYKSETMIGQLALAFTGMAVVVCCLGILGLAVFMAEQRTKEIGIRKVLGASILNILSLLTKDLLLLVLVAIVVATPLAWWAMSQWLRGFAYRIELSWIVFALAGLTAIIVAFITIAGQAYRAASANPVQALKAE